jgi:hypothetical protein
MTGGTHSSAAAAGGARGWAAPGRKRSGPLSPRCDGDPGCEAEGAQPDFGDLGSKPKTGQKWVKGIRNKGEGFFFFFLKNIQTNEFKYEFEFKHSKTMHQHVCNNELL